MSDSENSPNNSSSRRVLRSVPTSLATRGFELFKMAAKFGASHPLADDTVRRVEQAQAVVQSLSKLKGAAMKLGQTLSVELRDLLPPEFVDALSSLQDQGSSLSGEAIRGILQEEWGARRYADLQGFVDTPLASASIGQVHAGRLLGSDVVLKVQFPGIAKTVDSDIQGVGLLLKGLLAVSGRSVRMDSVLEELRDVFRQETDYLQEAAFLREFRSKILEFEGYRVPEVFQDYSTSRVLAMSRERGLKPLDWVRLRHPSQEVRNAVGMRFLNLYEIEFFRIGMVQTDPNFANFLIDDSESREFPTITLLDFGAVRLYDEPFRGAYRELLALGLSGTDDQLIEKCFEMNLLDSAEGQEGQAALVRLVRASLKPFDAKAQPFHFTNADYAREMRELALALAKACRVSAPPRSILFLHRKLGGIFNLLKSMEVELDLTNYWERIVRGDSVRKSV